MSQERCPRCAPFSPEVLALYKRFQGSADPDERGELLLQLASKFVDDYDPSDDGFMESFHSIVDSYHQNFLSYNQSGLRLGRVLLHIIENHSDADEQTDTTLNIPKQRVDPLAN
jgi:hypothetical protein